jgi:hypothetical protein
MLCLIAGAAVLSWSGVPTLESIIGPLAIFLACLARGLDNNLTRKVSLADPLQIVELKGLVAGPVNLAVGLWAGGLLPGTFVILLAAIVGFLGYGVSLAFLSFRFAIWVPREQERISRQRWGLLLPLSSWESRSASGSSWQERSWV